jgi:hypothetical protein
MHSVLFVASMGNHGVHEERTKWENFLMYVDVKLKRLEGPLRLAENIWLLNVQETVEPLGWLIAFSAENTISYGLLPFEHAPEWLPDGFDPKTIQARNVRPF